MKKLASLILCLPLALMLQAQPVQFQLKVFLQGPYQLGGTMKTSLGTSGYLPLTQPYHSGVWNYNGTEALTVTPADMVDWILVDLRLTPDTAVARMAAILYSDGSVRDVNGNANLVFNVPSGSYYVAVCHRSHLSAMSASKLSFPLSSILDFSDTTSLAVYGRCLISMSGGVMGMISGDLNDDKILKYSGPGNDRSLILQRILSVVGGTAINAITSGYYREDLRMDGMIKYSGPGNDPSLIIQNLVTLMGTTAINATFSGPVPHAVLDPSALQTFKTCGDTLLDIRDYQQYPTVLIGDHCWMAKNLNIGVMVNSSNTGNDHSDANDNGIIEKYCYSNDINYCDTYGGLYDWDEAMDYSLSPGVRGICPVGWHMPTVEEWSTLEDTLGGITLAGGKLKEAGLTHWSSPNTGATNETGFTALPAGFRASTGYFNTIGTHACFWSSTLQLNPYVWNRTLLHNYESIFQYSDYRTRGHSIRCIMDSIVCEPQPDQANAGPDMMNLPGVFVSLQGNQAVNGTGAWTIVSGTGGNLANSSAHNTQFSGHPGEIYTLVWTISTVCGSTIDTVMLGFACDPQYVPASAGPDVSICEGSCTQLTASGGVSFLWNTLETSASIQACPVGNSAYNVTVTDIYGCTASASVVITVYPLPVANAGPDVAICIEQCAPLLATGGVNYQWSTQETTADIIVCPTVTTVFTVTVTDMYGCVAMDDVSVTVNPLPLANAGADASVCQDDCAQLLASGGVTYLWSTQETTAGIEVCPASTTPYYVTVTDINGCAATDDVLVTVNPLPIVVAGPDTAICPGDCVQLTATGGLNYVWSTQETTATITVCPGQTMEYSVTGTDQNGCQSTAEVWVSILGLPNALAGPDTLNIPASSINLQGVEPFEGSGLWTVVAGSGGVLADSSLFNTLFSGMADSVYTLVWTVSNICGSDADTVHIGFSPVPLFPCEGLILDARDDAMYPIVQIGQQCWMAKNLNIGTMVNSSYSGGADHSSASNNGVIEKYCYNNLTASCDLYGGLYDWNEMMDYVLTPGVRGICPEGWYVPTDAEWKILEGNVDSQYGVGDSEWNYFGWRGSDAGGNVKHAGTQYWLTPNAGATNSSGFTALPAGLRWSVGWFGNIGAQTYFWTSTPYGTGNAYYRWLGYSMPMMWRDIDRKRESGFPVRCLRDPQCTDLPDQADAGPDTLNIPDIYVQLQANQAVNGTGVWTIASGSGGSFVNPQKYNTGFHGQSGETYQLVWSIVTRCLGYSDTLTVHFADFNPPTCDSTLLDPRDQKEYPVVKIGNQCWMAKNLNVGTYTPSIFVHYHDVHSDVSDNGIIEKYCYDNIESNCDIWGGLYDWDEMMDYDSTEGVQGICPPVTGWQVPTDNQWKIMEGTVDSYYGVGDPEWDLETARGTDVGGKLKEAGYSHWSSPNTGATNSTGFTALPAGWRYFAGFFDSQNEYTFFWTSTDYPTVVPYAFTRQINHDGSTMVRSGLYKPFGFSVRCVKELPPCSPQPTQANAGIDQIDISGSTAQLQANQPTIGYGTWAIESGFGGSISDPSDYQTVFHGVPGVTYVLSWTITNICGNLVDLVTISFADTTVFSCGDTLIDIRDGKHYPTVQIGTHCWMAKNLDHGVQVQSVYTGTDHSELTNNGIIEKYCLDNSSALCNVYGGLYTWDEMMNYTTNDGSTGICPPVGSWRLPTDADWKRMEGAVDSQYGIGDPEWDDYSYRGYDAGQHLMDSHATNWSSNYTYIVGDNASGFTALPGEARYNDGEMSQDTKYDGYFWTSTQSSLFDAWMRNLTGDREGVYRGDWEKNNAFSVRCLKDMPQSCSPQPDQANAGSDSADIQGSSIQLQANQPSAGDGQWSILSGIGGSFADPNQHNTTFQGQEGYSYVLVWTISTICGETTDTINISFATPIIQTCGVLEDTRDGQTYPTVIIGNLCWMAKNLNVGVMVNSQNTGANHSDVANNGSIEKYCYNNDTNECNTYGGLYDWREATQYLTFTGAPTICPTGWRIPSDAEWTTMTSALGGLIVAGGKLKETGFVHWDSPNAEATNISGFTALGAGWRNWTGAFSYQRTVAFFWTSTSASTNYAWSRNMGTYAGDVSRYDSIKTMGASLRCVKNLP